MVLVFVLVVVAIMALAAFTFCELMLTERKASLLLGNRAQARQSAHSGIEMVAAVLSQDQETIDGAGGLLDNTNLFRGVVVVEDSSNPGRVTIVSTKLDETGVPYFGLENESGRINLNTLLEIGDEDEAREVLMALPNMTIEAADSILDWIDEDDTPREYGAEIDFYSQLQPAYAPKNGPLDTIEQLLGVQGVTPELLFGADSNYNGLVDPGELQTGEDSMAEFTFATEGSPAGGIARWLTLYSVEKNLQADGQPRINLNEDDLQQLHEKLKEVLESDWATFIVAYRQNGPYDGDGRTEEIRGRELNLEDSEEAEESQPQRVGEEEERSEEGGDSDQRGGPPQQENASAGKKTELENILDLIGAKVRVTFKGDRQPTVIDSPFSKVPGEMSQYMPKLMDAATLDDSATISGRINVNLADPIVLAAIPGISESTVERIIAERELNVLDADESRRHATWLLSEGIVDLEEMKKLMPYVTAGGSVYRFQSIGYFDRGGPTARFEVVLDASEDTTKTVLLRDLGSRGPGYPLELLGTDEQAE